MYVYPQNLTMEVSHSYLQEAFFEILNKEKEPFIVKTSISM